MLAMSNGITETIYARQDCYCIVEVACIYVVDHISSVELNQSIQPIKIHAIQIQSKIHVQMQVNRISDTYTVACELKFKTLSSASLGLKMQQSYRGIRTGCQVTYMRCTL